LRSALRKRQPREEQLLALRDSARAISEANRGLAALQVERRALQATSGRVVTGPAPQLLVPIHTDRTGRYTIFGAPMRGPGGAESPKAYLGVRRGSKAPPGPMWRRPNVAVLAEWGT